MYQFNIVIADDEDVISSGIQKQLLQEFSNINIGGVYANGIDVIAHLKKEEVNILISDIRMPGASGIDIAKYIAEKELQTKMIVITGHRDFEYAKKLLDYHTYSLIMKPIDIDLLLETVSRIMEETSQQQDIVLNEARQMLFLHDLKRQRIASVIFGEKKPEEIASEYFTLEHSNDFLYMPCAMIDIFPQQAEQVDEEKFGKTMWQSMGEIQTDSYDVYAISSFYNKGTFLLIANNTNIINLEEKVKQFSENLCKDLQTTFMIPCSYTFQIYNCISEISLLENDGFTDMYIEYVMHNNIQGRRNYLKTIISGYSFKRLCDIANELINRISELYNMDFSSQQQKIDGAVSKEEAINILNEIDRIVDSYHASDDITAISKIISYINEKFWEEITLDRISDKFNLSKSHISRLFKRKTGENFVDYLNHLRVNKAKEFIKENKYTVGEIAYKVGYANPRYFGQVFKGITGMTPRQYFMSNIE